MTSRCDNCMEATGGAAGCPHCGWTEGMTPESPLYLIPGTVLKEQYIVGRVLGHGGFGITYLGWDQALARKVAIKEYFPGGVGMRTAGTPDVFPYSVSLRADYQWGLDRYLDEARVLARFEHHPNIVAIRSYFAAHGTAYLILEYLDGLTFEKYLEQKGGRVDWPTALKIATPVMDALREVHQTELLHRDISPDNIYLLRSGPVKVIDFGAARYSMGQHSRNLSVILKPGYAPPEQYQTKGQQGPWTDVYAMACTLYRALTGQIPPSAPDRQGGEPLPAPSALGVSMPPASEQALLRALSLKGDGRFATMSEFQQALTSSPAQPLSAPLPPPAPPPDPLPVPKPGWLWPAAGGIALAILAALFLMPRAAPDVRYFRATPSDAEPGTPVVLSWSVSEAKEVTIQGLGRKPAVGSATVNPQQTTTYTLTAEANRKSTTARTAVTVTPPAVPRVQIARFAVEPAQVRPGQPATLSWDVQGATEVRVGGEAVGITGSTAVRAASSTEYRLVARGPDGATREAVVTLVVDGAGNTVGPGPVQPQQAPEILRFEFSPPAVTAGQTTELRWSTRGATLVRLDDRPVQATGRVAVRPTQALRVRLTAEGPGGAVSREAALSLVQSNPQTGVPRILSFGARPSVVRSGESTTLAWQVADAARIVVAPEIGVVAAQGEAIVTPRASGRYTLTALDRNGRATTRVAVVTVLASPKPPAAPADTPPGPFTGQPSTRVSWNVYHHHGLAAIPNFDLDFGRGTPNRQGNNSSTGCYGTLALDGQQIRYDSRGSNDGFAVNYAEVQEVKGNRFNIGGHRAFHVKIRGGRNFNFVPREPADAVVSAIQKALGLR